jgi:hypothetical protein
MENNAAMPAANGVMKEVLSTPFVKDIIRSNLQNVKPDTTHPLVNALIWQEPELILSILGSLPPVVNSCTSALTTLGKQVNENLTPALIRDYLVGILKDINTDEIKALADAYITLGKNLWEASPEFRAVIGEALMKDAPPLIGQGINSACRLVNEVSREEPQVVSRFVSDIVKNIDGEEFKNATHTLVNAFWDQKPPLLSWVWQLVRKRMKRKK